MFRNKTQDVKTWFSPLWKWSTKLWICEFSFTSQILCIHGSQIKLGVFLSFQFFLLPWNLYLCHQTAPPAAISGCWQVRTPHGLKSLVFSSLSLCPSQPCHYGNVIIHTKIASNTFNFFLSLFLELLKISLVNYTLEPVKFVTGV